MPEKRVHGVLIECVQGDIASQPDMQAVVNAANAWLRPGGGVAGAIHRAAGPGLEEECRVLAPINPGEAVISGAHNLPNEYVIHCLGPVYGRDEPAAELLADCYRNAVRVAEENAITSIAFPSISTGVFGYPKHEAAQVAFKTILDLLPSLKTLRHIRFVLFSAEDASLHAEVFEALVPEENSYAG
ncbi:MAG: macro domain-containing protein [Thermodesulfobacteriota bacterium]